MEQRPYTNSTMNPRVASATDFQLNYDLYIDSPRGTQNLQAAIELTGGVYVLLTLVVGWLFSQCVPYLMYLSVIRTLFKMDTNEF